jgi:hypothetical protein
MSTLDTEPTDTFARHATSCTVANLAATFGCAWKAMLTLAFSLSA